MSKRDQLRQMINTKSAKHRQSDGQNISHWLWTFTDL